MKATLRARALGKKFTLIFTAYVLAVSSLTASVPFILSKNANAVDMAAPSLVVTPASCDTKQNMAVYTGSRENVRIKIQQPISVRIEAEKIPESQPFDIVAALVANKVTPVYGNFSGEVVYYNSTTKKDEFLGTVAGTLVDPTSLDCNAPKVYFQVAPADVVKGVISIRPRAEGEADGSLIDKYIYLNDKQIGHDYSANRNFDYKIDTVKYQDGIHTLRFVAIDEAGNRSEVSKQFKVDNSGPVVSFTSPLANSVDGGKVRVSGVVDEDVASLVLHPRKIKDNGKFGGFLATIPVTVDDNGLWSVEVDMSDSSKYTDGVYGFTALATDLVGNSNGGGAHFKSFNLQNSYSSVNISNVSLGVNKLLNFTIDATDVNPGVRTVGVNIYDSQNKEMVLAIGRLAHDVNTGTKKVGPLNQSINVSSLASGIYTIRAAVRDWDGNTLFATYKVNVDNSAPILSIGTPAIERNGDIFTPVITSNEEASYTWTQLTGPEEIDTASWNTLSPEISPSEYGSYSFQVVATDVAGNNSEPVVVSFSFQAPPAPAPDPEEEEQPSTGSPDDGAPEPDTGSQGGQDDSNTQPNGGLPFSTFGAAGVLGLDNESSSAADTDGDPEVQGISTANTLAAAVDNTNGKAFGLAWYWWLLIVAAVAGAAWWIAAAVRRRQAE